MKNIAVVYGGYSSEYEISVKSGRNVAAELRKAGFNVYEVLLTRESWDVVDADRRYSVSKDDFSAVIGGERVHFDKVFIIVHGDPGENGLLQAYFEMLQIPFMGCSSLVDSVSFDKYFCKRALADLPEVRMAADVRLLKGRGFEPEEIVAKLGLPVFVKPCNGGSSFGLTKVKKTEDLPSAVEYAFSENADSVLIESAISGREIDCAVYTGNDGKARALPLLEIVSQNEFFDYEAKYLGASQELCPAPVDAVVTAKVQRAAVEIFEHLGCRDLVRMDFIVSPDGEVFFLEVNPNPGMTAESIVPKMVAAAGIRMEDFLADLANR